MTLQEAQERSIIGVAVLGNPAMQDIIWPKGSNCAYLFIIDHYKAQLPGRWATRTEWEPLNELHEVGSKLLADLRATPFTE